MPSLKEKLNAKIIMCEMEDIGIDMYDVIFDTNGDRCVLVFSCIEDLHLYNILGNFKEGSTDVFSEISYVIHSPLRNYFDYAKRRLNHITKEEFPHER